jgi:hypothetical protein
VLITTAVSGGSALAADFPAAPSTAAGVRVTVVAGGLHDPRGLAIGPGNDIYVAEAGTTVGMFVPPPPPPHNGPLHARGVKCIGQSGRRCPATPAVFRASTRTAAFMS